MTDEKSTEQPSNVRVEDDINPTIADDEQAEAQRAFLQLCRLLRDHQEALKQRKNKHPDWIGRQELNRRIAVFLGMYANRPIPRELLDLVVNALCGRTNAFNSKGRLFLKWTSAAMEEAKTPIGEDGYPYPATVYSVARAAFGKRGDHRSTIRKWRKEYDYGYFVKTLRTGWEIEAAQKAGASKEECDRIRYSVPAPDLASGLRLTTHPHGEINPLKSHLHTYLESMK